jgi:small subunit ribosomal protein S17
MADTGTSDTGTSDVGTSDVGTAPETDAPVAAEPKPKPVGKSASASGGAVPSDGAVRPNRRKVREGLVVSVKMDKTAVVGVIERVRHPRYAKTVQRTKRLYAHDTENDLRVGDRVRIAETRPMSKLKRWRVVEVLERAK